MTANLTPDRRHIATALRALHGADLALGAYAEHGHADDLGAAHDAARRVYRSLRQERRRRRIMGGGRGEGGPLVNVTPSLLDGGGSVTVCRH
jgi:hypothetical protein